MRDRLPAALVGGRLDVNVGNTVPVTGTFFQATQPVSAASLPLPTGAAAEHTTAASPNSARLTDGAAFYKATTPADTQPVSGTFFQATQPVSGTVTANAGAGPFPVSDNAGSLTVDGVFFQATQPVSLATNTPDVTDRAARLLGIVYGSAGQVKQTAASGLAVAADIAQVVQDSPQDARAAVLIVTGTAAAGTGVTVTLPAAAAGLFHYITRINIVKYASVATVGAAAPTVVTSTNLPGALAWTLPTALAVGTQYETDVEPASPIKSSVAATATTIVAGALASIIYRITVYYYTAP